MSDSRYVGDLVKRWELADPRDRWRHTGEKAPPWHVRNGPLGTKESDNEKTQTASSSG
jgi:hypothetical protein